MLVILDKWVYFDSIYVLKGFVSRQNILIKMEDMRDSILGATDVMCRSLRTRLYSNIELDFQV